MKAVKRTLKEFYLIFVRQLRAIFTDGGVVLFFLFLPIAYPVIYSLIYNPELVREVKIVVVDNDRTPLSREVTRRMNASQWVHVTGYAANLSEGKKAMDSHHCFAIMEIPDGFERKAVNGETGNAVIYCDMSLLLRYRGILVAATDVQTDLGTEFQAATLNKLPEGGSLYTGDPMPIENVSLGNIEDGFDSFIMPGIIIFILHQCLILAVGMMGGAVNERPGLMSFNPMVRHPPILMEMLARVCVCLLVLMPGIFYLIHYIPLMFCFPMSGNIWEIFLFLLPMCIGAIFLGEVLQAIVRQREDVFVIWVATSVAILFLSGITWPRFAMTPFWKAVGDILPATWGVEGFIKMNSNASTLTQVKASYIMEWVLVGGWGIAAYVCKRFIMLPRLRRGFLSLPSIRKTLHP